MARCSSHYERKAIGTIPYTHYSGREQADITTEIAACQECLNAWNTDRAIETPFTREWHTAQVDRLANQMRGTIADWFEGGRDDPKEVQRIYGQMLTASRALAAELGAIGTLNYQEAVRAK